MQTYFKNEFKVDIQIDSRLEDIEISNEILKKFGFDLCHEHYHPVGQATMDYFLNKSSVFSDKLHKAIYLTRSILGDDLREFGSTTIEEILEYVNLSIENPEIYSGYLGYHPFTVDSIDGYIGSNDGSVDVRDLIDSFVGEDSLGECDQILYHAKQLARSQNKIEDFLEGLPNEWDNQRDVYSGVDSALTECGVKFKKEEEAPAVVETPVKEKEDLTIVVGKQPKPINVRYLFEHDLTELHNFVFNYIQDEIVPEFDSVSDIENYLKTTTRSDSTVCSEENPFIDLLDRACDYVGKDKKMEFAFAFDTLHNNTLWQYIVECDRALEEIEID